MNFRKERMGEEVRTNLARMIREELELKDMLATITEVVVAGDLSEARVRVSVLPDEQGPEAIRILSKFAGRFQGMLVRQMNIKPIPRIAFELDLGPQRAALIEKKLMGSDTSL
ncbi:MAG: ribosome-binding factor A [Candidatus Pacebacteria bacterium]|nr:ribosome-binding factor A [Candidatus Paceibacterota bacterium]